MPAYILAGLMTLGLLLPAAIAYLIYLLKEESVGGVIAIAIGLGGVGVGRVRQCHGLGRFGLDLPQLVERWRRNAVDRGSHRAVLQHHHDRHRAGRGLTHTYGSVSESSASVGEVPKSLIVLKI